jgi:hypothetical protein
MGGTISSMMTHGLHRRIEEPLFQGSLRSPCGLPLLAPSSRIRIRAERAALRVPPRKTTRRAYLFPAPCEFLTAIAASPWCIAVVPRKRNGSDAPSFCWRNNNRREITLLLRRDGLDVVAIPQPSHAWLSG